MISFVRMINDQVFYAINHGSANPVFDLLMPIFTFGGDGAVLVVIGVLLLVLPLGRAQKITALLLLAGLTLTYHVVALLKVAVASPRPFLALPDVRLVAGIEKSFSFPSNHTANAFMLLAICGTLRTPYRVLLAFFACVVAFSRIYIGVHFPIDIIGGAVVGYCIGLMLRYYSGKSITSP